MAGVWGVHGGHVRRVCEGREARTAGADGDLPSAPPRAADSRRPEGARGWRSPEARCQGRAAHTKAPGDWGRGRSRRKPSGTRRPPRIPGAHPAQGRARPDGCLPPRPAHRDAGRGSRAPARAAELLVGPGSGSSSRPDPTQPPARPSGRAIRCPATACASAAPGARLLPAAVSVTSSRRRLGRGHPGSRPRLLPAAVAVTSARRRLGRGHPGSRPRLLPAAVSVTSARRRLGRGHPGSRFRPPPPSPGAYGASRPDPTGSRGPSSAAPCRGVTGGAAPRPPRPSRARRRVTTPALPGPPANCPFACDDPLLPPTLPPPRPGRASQRAAGCGRDRVGPSSSLGAGSPNPQNLPGSGSSASRGTRPRGAPRRALRRCPPGQGAAKAPAGPLRPRPCQPAAFLRTPSHLPPRLPGRPPGGNHLLSPFPEAGQQECRCPPCSHTAQVVAQMKRQEQDGGQPRPEAVGSAGDGTAAPVHPRPSPRPLNVGASMVEGRCGWGCPIKRVLTSGSQDSEEAARWPRDWVPSPGTGGMVSARAADGRPCFSGQGLGGRPYSDQALKLPLSKDGLGSRPVTLDPSGALGPGSPGEPGRLRPPTSVGRGCLGSGSSGHPAYGLAAAPVPVAHLRPLLLCPSQRGPQKLEEPERHLPWPVSAVLRPGPAAIEPSPTLCAKARARAELTQAPSLGRLQAGPSPWLLLGFPHP
ncbi:collagen alpha-1(II) chain-like [Choloepus didactylus]|uniref:collagen alpha-1(II) chain-like n=1 Tax=Choloepus didactylus TaxID=27675 RepID=UPI00189FE3DD|nr:collagen alpha-1(II) chain-like [Choloepus didactylus]